MLPLISQLTHLFLSFPLYFSWLQKYVIYFVLLSVPFSFLLCFLILNLYSFFPLSIRVSSMQKNDNTKNEQLFGSFMQVSEQKYPLPVLLPGPYKSSLMTVLETTQTSTSVSQLMFCDKPKSSIIFTTSHTTPSQCENL